MVPDTYFCGGAPLMDGYPLSAAAQVRALPDLPYMLIEPGQKVPPESIPRRHTPAAVVARMKRPMARSA